MSLKKPNHRNNETQDQIIDRLKVKPSRSVAFLLASRPPPPPVLEYPAQSNRPYTTPSRQVQFLKASMRFIPVLNNNPDARNTSGPPYLFNFKGRQVSYAPGAVQVEKKPQRLCLPRPKKDEKNYDTVGLECEAGMTQRVKKIQEQLLMAYTEYQEQVNAAKIAAGEIPGRDRVESMNDMFRRWSIENPQDAEDDTDSPVILSPQRSLDLLNSPLEEKMEPPAKKTLDIKSSEQIPKQVRSHSAKFKSDNMSNASLFQGSNILKESATRANLESTAMSKESVVTRRRSTESSGNTRLIPSKSKVEQKSIGGSKTNNARGKAVPFGPGHPEGGEPPAGAVLGYLGQDGEFMELFKGETIPEGATRAYLTW